MFRNMYDTDVTVWSPQGRLHQVEYAMEAVKQGSATVGIKSEKFAVLSAYRRQPSELASYQKKLIKIDSHVGIGIAGLNADARSLVKHMRSQCLNYKYNFNSPYSTLSLVKHIALKHQKCTQTYVRRPYGVGLLVIGYDNSGAHLFETCPSGNYFDYHADAIGAKSQSARTYLSKLFDDNDEPLFKNAGADELIKYAIEALSGCTEGDKPLTAENTSVSIVGDNVEFRELSTIELQAYLNNIAATAENVLEVE